VTPPLTFPVTDQEEYQAWLAAHHPSPAELAAERAAAATLPLRPLISVVVPVFDPPERFLREALDSVLDQTYDRFELCLVDDGSSSPAVREGLDEYAARDGRVSLTRH
jgi:O-antigen biosynthesis protein